MCGQWTLTTSAKRSWERGRSRRFDCFTSSQSDRRGCEGAGDAGENTVAARLAAHEHADWQAIGVVNDWLGDNRAAERGPGPDVARENRPAAAFDTVRSPTPWSPALGASGRENLIRMRGLGNDPY